MPRNKANDGLGEMDVEVVANDIPPCVGGGAAQQGVEKTSKVLLGPGVADHPGDFADRDIETGDQGLRAVAAILEFAPLDLARLHRQPRRDALQRSCTISLPLSASQMRAVLSSDAVSTRLPSGLKPALCTGPVWPLSRRWSCDDCAPPASLPSN